MDLKITLGKGVIKIINSGPQSKEPRSTTAGLGGAQSSSLNVSPSGVGDQDWIPDQTFNKHCPHFFSDVGWVSICLGPTIAQQHGANGGQGVSHILCPQEAYLVVYQSKYSFTKT